MLAWCSCSIISFSALPAWPSESSSPQSFHNDTSFGERNFLTFVDNKQSLSRRLMRRMLQQRMPQRHQCQKLRSACYYAITVEADVGVPCRLQSPCSKVTIATLTSSNHGSSKRTEKIEIASSKSHQDLMLDWDHLAGHSKEICPFYEATRHEPPGGKRKRGFYNAPRTSRYDIRPPVLGYQLSLAASADGGSAFAASASTEIPKDRGMRRNSRATRG